MIIDSLHNAATYHDLHPLFSKAFEFVKENDLMNLPDGTIQIEDGLKVIVSQKNGKTPEESLQKFECHNASIDIQICVKGAETIGWKPRENCSQPKGEYDPVKDVLFFADDPDMYFNLKDGQFVIFYPGDVHAPMIGEDVIRKLVFKVKI